MIDLTQVYRLRNGIDKINRPLFRPVSECHSFATRSSRKGNIAGHKTSLDLRKNFFTNRVITGWNALPQDVQTSSSLNSSSYVRSPRRLADTSDWTSEAGLLVIEATMWPKIHLINQHFFQ